MVIIGIGQHYGAIDSFMQHLKLSSIAIKLTIDVIDLLSKSGKDGI